MPRCLDRPLRSLAASSLSASRSAARASPPGTSQRESEPVRGFSTRHPWPRMYAFGNRYRDRWTIDRQRPPLSTIGKKSWIKAAVDRPARESIGPACLLASSEEHLEDCGPLGPDTGSQMAGRPAGARPHAGIAIPANSRLVGRAFLFLVFCWRWKALCTVEPVVESVGARLATPRLRGKSGVLRCVPPAPHQTP